MNSKQKKEYFRRNNENKKSKLSNKGSITYLIEDSESVDLTGEDIMKICNGKVKVISYHQLADVKSIEDLLSPHGAVVLLYETKQNFGHYTALFYDKNNDVEFFDSYGLKPDEELKYATYDNTPYLTNLLEKYKKKVLHNPVRLQQFIKDVNTCGRWTSLRIRMKDLTFSEFQKYFENLQFYNPDFYVSALTFLYTY